MIGRVLHDDVLEAAYEAVLDIAVTAIVGCDHDRHHGHRACPICRSPPKRPTGSKLTASSNETPSHS